jgi:hypothetical protein
VRSLTPISRAKAQGFTMTLAAGSIIFITLVVVFLLSAVYGIYTRRGSGINQRPYANAYSNAPGAQGSSTIGNDRVAAQSLTRGTR